MENKPSAFVVSIGYSVIISLAVIVLTLILFLLNLDKVSGLEWLSYLILIGGLWLAQLNYRNKYLGGFITYGQVVTIGAWISLFIGIIMGLFTFIFFKYINPGGMEEAMALAEQKMMDKGMTDLEIEQGMAIANKFASVGMYTFIAVIGNFILGVIFSLITAIFVKKENSGFDQPSN
jgi:hypothetical protein